MLERMERADFDGMFRLLQESLPEEEYRSRTAQAALFDDPRYAVYSAGKRGAPDAFIAVWTLPGWRYIEHFAVSQKLRGQGLGTAVLRELFSLLPGRYCLEAEPPETEIARRRVAFYERSGFALNPYAYDQPPLAEGRAYLPLKLLTTGGALTEAEFSALRMLLYRAVYGLPDASG